MGWAERANPRSLRNLIPSVRAAAIRDKEAAREERQAQKVYANPMSYMQAFVISIMRSRREREEQRKTAEAKGGNE